jgi:hypothetical protein
MTYTTDDRLFRRQVEEARAAAGGGPARVWAGIGAYRMDLAGVLAKLALARAARADGVILFSHESLGSGDLSRLREALLSDKPVAVPGAGPGAASGP